MEHWIANLSLLIMGTAGVFEPDPQVQKHLHKIIAIEQRIADKRSSYADRMKKGFGLALIKKKEEIKLEESDETSEEE